MLSAEKQQSIWLKMLKVCLDSSEYFCIFCAYLFAFTDNSGQLEARVFSEETNFLKSSI